MPALEPFSQLAEAIADGHPLQWNEAELTVTSDDDRAALAAFRQLAVVGRLFATASTSASRPRRQERTILAPGTSWGALQIRSHVGRGRFGNVYRAWDPTLDRDVALKLIDDDTYESPDDVIREGQLMARVRHPNVVAIHGAQRIDGVTGLSMEFVEGRTLEAELTERGFFSATDLIDTGVQVCRALAAVHDAGLVHRDVKAPNILRDRASGRVMLGDFGTGRRFEETAAAPGTLAGTPAYLAPEVFAGGSATPRSDLYSVGVLLFRLATGEYPIQGRSIGALKAAHARGERAQLGPRGSSLPNSVVAVIDRALEADPSQRFESAAAMASGLEACRPKSNQWRTGWVAAAVVLVVAGALVGRAIWSTPSPLNFAARDAVLVTKFENRTGEPLLDDTIEHALELELMNSPFAAVASRERVAETLALMRRPADTLVDLATGREIALRDGKIRVVISGRVERIGSEYRISARLVNPVDESAVGSAVGTARSPDGLLATIEVLARDVRRRLGETLPALPPPVAALPKVRTQSLKALKLYAQALGDLLGIENKPVAVQLLTQAAVLDPEFALAHIALARAKMPRESTDMTADLDSEIRAHLKQAVALVGPENSERHIVIAESEYLLGRLTLGENADRVQERKAHYERSARSTELWLDQQPFNERGLDLTLALHLEFNVAPSVSLPVSRRIVELRPNSLGAVRRLVGRLFLAGEFAEGHQYLARARLLLEQQTAEHPEDLPVWLFEDAWARGDFDEASKWIVRMETQPDPEKPTGPTRYGLPLVMACLSLGQLDRAEKWAERIPNRFQNALRRLTVLRARQAPNLAKSTADALKNPVLTQASVTRLDLLIRAGQFGEAHRVIDATRRRGPLAAGEQNLEARLFVAEGRAQSAIAVLEPLVSQQPSPMLQTSWFARAQILADAYERGDRQPDAIRVLEEVIKRKVEVRHPGFLLLPEWLTAVDRLAQLYRKAGRVEDATRVESELARRLAKADADHPIRVRLASVSK